MLRANCVPESENKLRASTQKVSAAGAFGEEIAGQKRNGPGVSPGRFNIADLSGVPATLDGLFGSVLCVIQARNSVEVLMHFDAMIADRRELSDEALGELAVRFRECWALYEASFPTTVRLAFKPLFGVKFRRFEFALSAAAWTLASEEVRNRHMRNPGAVLTLAEVLGHE